FRRLEILEQADIKNYTTMKVSCICSAIIFPKTVLELNRLLNTIKTENGPYVILGAGSNLLFKNKTFNGVVICLLKLLPKIKVSKQRLYATSSILVGQLLKQMQEHSLSGLEFLAGIPASVGGIVAMNAGAFGLCVGGFIEKVKVLKDGKVVWLKSEDCKFLYRSSIFKTNNYLVLGVVFKLNPKSKQESNIILQTFLSKRRSAQPSGYSCGSIFKNPTECPAGFLIDSLNLKGYSIGGAEVSNKHANFIVNNKNATGEDVFNLINFIKNEVYNKYKIELETEVVIIGENNK
ncbi:MAG: UDP-N-acetylmuramate dehydrogenase, partial [Clostridia bacterium]|nr:UDP-N-acetylmuramate dehydrogenase [Clostridia bacterium]